MSLKQEIRSILDDTSLSHEDVRRALSALNTGWKAQRTLATFAPQIYRRDRRTFVTFLEEIVRADSLSGNLDAWLTELDQNNDVALHRAVLKYQLNQISWSKRYKNWETRLTNALEARPDDTANVLAKYDCGLQIDDPFAAKLYPLAPTEVTDWIIRQEERNPWSDQRFDKTLEVAQQVGEDENFFRIYKACVGAPRWQADVERLAASDLGARALDAALERYHPRPVHEFHASNGYLALIEARGEEALDYVLRHLSDFPTWIYWNTPASWQKLMEIAESNGWWALWGGIVGQHIAETTFNDLVISLSKQGPEVAIQRLVLLAGAKSTNQFHRLNAKATLALYTRYPELATGPFRLNFVIRRADEALAKVAQAAAARGDDEMVDFLASRAMYAVTPLNDQKSNVGWYVEYYNHLAPSQLADRLINVLGQVSTVNRFWNYTGTGANDLHQFLLAEPTRVLIGTAPLDGLHDLLENPHPEIQLLALRALATPSGAEFANGCAEHLMHLMVGRVPRNPRILAIKSLIRVGRSSLDWGERVLHRFRVSLRYQGPIPRDRVIEGIGYLLDRWPTLRSNDESMPIYGM